MECGKSNARSEFHSKTSQPQKKKTKKQRQRDKTNNINLHLKHLEKEEQQQKKNPKVRWRKEIIKTSLVQFSHSVMSDSL